MAAALEGLERAGEQPWCCRTHQLNPLRLGTDEAPYGFGKAGHASKLRLLTHRRPTRASRPTYPPLRRATWRRFHPRSAPSAITSIPRYSRCSRMRSARPVMSGHDGYSDSTRASRFGHSAGVHLLRWR